MSETRLFSNWFTLGFACLLLVPAALTVWTPLEPFPAVMLPGGGPALRVDKGEATFTALRLAARDGAGKFQRLVVNEFIEPIPDYYIHSMLRDGFGLSKRLRPLRVHVGPVAFRVPRRERSKQERESLVDWLKARLRQSGFADDSFVVYRDTLTIDMVSGNELNRRTRRVGTIRIR